MQRFLNYLSELIFHAVAAVALLAVGCCIAAGAEAVPAATAADILANPDAALAANQDQAGALLDAWLTNPWVSWGVAAGVLILGVTRRLAPGIWGIAANAAYHLLATVSNRETAMRKWRNADVGNTLVRVIEDMPNEGSVGELKAEIRERIGWNLELEQAIQETIAEHRAAAAVEDS